MVYEVGSEAVKLQLVPLHKEMMNMQILWGILMIMAGLFMLISGLMKSNFVIYRILVARSKILWGENVHRFYQIAGSIVVVFGVLMAIGIKPKNLVWSLIKLVH